MRLLLVMHRLLLLVVVLLLLVLMMVLLLLVMLLLLLMLHVWCEVRVWSSDGDVERSGMLVLLVVLTGVWMIGWWRRMQGRMCVVHRRVQVGRLRVRVHSGQREGRHALWAAMRSSIGGHGRPRPATDVCGSW